MKYVVHVSPGRGRDEVTETSPGFLEVTCRAKPSGGQATEATLQLIARYFRVARSDVRLILGKTSREKLVEIAKPAPR